MVRDDAVRPGFRSTLSLLRAVRFLRAPVAKSKGGRRFDRALRRRAPLFEDQIVDPAGVAVFHRGIICLAHGSRFFGALFLPEGRSAARVVVGAAVAASTPDDSPGSCVVNPSGRRSALRFQLFFSPAKATSPWRATPRSNKAWAESCRDGRGTSRFPHRGCWRWRR